MFLYSKKWNSLAPRLKEIYIFSKKSFSNILANRTFHNMELSSSKIATYLIFPEMELSSLEFKQFQDKTFQAQEIKKICSEKIPYILRNGTFLYFTRKFAKLKKQTFLIFIFNFFVVVDRELFKHKRKRKKFLILSLKSSKIF